MNRVLKIAIALALTVILAGSLIRNSPALRRNVSARDSLAYWAASYLLVHLHDPYNHAAVMDLEAEQGYRESRPLVLRTPPWSLFLVLPLGWLSPFEAWILWLALLLGCLVLGLRLTRKLYDPAASTQNLLAIVVYTFAPVPACLVSGQMGLVLMLGVVLFLWLHEEHSYWAGAALLLPFAKPHLLSLFWLTLAVWIVSKKKTKIAIGFGAAFVGGTLAALIFDPHAFAHYHEMMQVAAIQKEFIPALSGVLRLLFFRRLFWMQFVPMIIGLGWCAYYFIRNHHHWDWRQHGPALLVVSVLVTPYGWLSDETVVLPAIVQATVILYGIRHNLRAWSKLMLGFFVFLNLLLLLILRFKIPFSTGIYFWSSLVWFGFYFYALRLQTRTLRSDTETPSSEALPS